MLSLHFQNNWVAQKNIFFINLKNLISIIWSSKNIGILWSRTLVLACSCSKYQIYTPKIVSLKINIIMAETVPKPAIKTPNEMPETMATIAKIPVSHTKIIKT